MRRTPLTTVLVALLLVSAAVATSCGGGGLSGGTTPVANHDSPAASLIGPAGGSVSTSGGASVTIPAGALAGAQNITITPSSTPGPADATPVGPEYDLGPDGTTFAKPVTVTLAIDPARIPPGKRASDVAVYTRASGSTDFTRLPTTIVDATHVSATTTHFSHVEPAIDTKKERGSCTDPKNTLVAGKQYTSDPFDPEPTIKDDGTAAPWAPKDPTVLTEWNPSTTSFCRPKFCNGDSGHTLSPTPSPHPRSRMARYRLDEGCQRHLPPAGGDRLCTKGNGPSLSTVKATACVDIEYVYGAAAAKVTPLREDDVICVQCPDPTMSPKLGEPCQSGQIDLANAHYPIFNVRGEDIEKAEAWFKAGVATKGKSATSPPAAQIAFLNAVRVLAPDIGYCEGARPAPNHPEAPYMTETPGSAWKYAEHYWDLNREFVFVEGTTFANVPNSNEFTAGQQGVGDGATFDLDGLVLGLWHEMRHMGTINFGAGETAAIDLPSGAAATTKDQVAEKNTDISNAEHMLNELEDYSLMQVYPWFNTIPAQRAPQFFNPEGTGVYDDGWKQERACFAWEWGLPDATGPGSFDGYPPDKHNSPPMYLLTSHEVWGGKTLETGTIPCAGGAPLEPRAPPDGAASTEAERCAVAQWAFNRQWMREQMARSLNITQLTPLLPGVGLMPLFPGMMGPPAPAPPTTPLQSDKAVWNILAHWTFGVPARMAAYCPSRTVPQ